jgi:hypothetical protein
MLKDVARTYEKEIQPHTGSVGRLFPGFYYHLQWMPAATRDHVPPRGMFPKPLPTDLITVPSCHTCNSASSLDDEYFRLVVSACSNDSPRSMVLLNQKILPKAREKPLLAKRFLKSCARVPEFSPGGIYVGQARAVTFERQRIQVVVNKIVRGLFLQHTGQALGSNRIVEDFVCQPKLSPEVIERISCLPLFKVGDGTVFSYRYELPEPQGAESAWFPMFYNDAVLFIATTGLVDTYSPSA